MSAGHESNERLEARVMGPIKRYCKTVLIIFNHTIGIHLIGLLLGLDLDTIKLLNLFRDYIRTGTD